MDNTNFKNQIKDKKQIFIFEPHPGDAVGLAAGLCYSEKCSSNIFTLSANSYQSNICKNKISGLSCGNNSKLRKSLNVINHIFADLENLDYDCNINGKYNKYEELILKNLQKYGEERYSKLYRFVSDKIEYITENFKNNNTYIAIPLGAAHPIHILTTASCIECLLKYKFKAENIIIYVDHPYDMYDYHSKNEKLAKKYIEKKLGISLVQADDLSANNEQIGDVIKYIYNEETYNNLKNSLNKALCSYFINSAATEEISSFLNLKRNDILLAASQSLPFYKTGGFGEIVYQYSDIMSGFVNDIRVILPKYELIGFDAGKIKNLNLTRSINFIYQPADGSKLRCSVEEYTYNGVIYYLLNMENPYGRYNRGEMSAVFCDCILQKVLHMIDFKPNIIHCNDWETALVPFLLKVKYHNDSMLNNIKTVYTIHAYVYKGIFQKDKILNLIGINKAACNLCLCCNDKCALDKINLLPREQIACLHAEPFFMSFMQAGISFSDIVTTVSSGYAQEIQAYPEFSGKKVIGIRNGISNKKYKFDGDSKFKNISEKFFKNTALPFNEKEKMLDDYKLHNKTELQKICGLFVNKSIPLVCIVSRLTSIKGFDNLKYVFDEMMKLSIQLLIVGDEDKYNPVYEDFFRRKSKQYNGKFSYFNYDELLERETYAGADILLMPSVNESCGITQMYAMKYGVVPIVTDLLSFRDTISALGEKESKDKGIGFFTLSDGWMLLEVLYGVIKIYNNKSVWHKLMEKCMLADFSWFNGSIKKYLEVYNGL